MNLSLNVAMRTNSNQKYKQKIIQRKWANTDKRRCDVKRM